MTTPAAHPFDSIEIAGGPVSDETMTLTDSRQDCHDVAHTEDANANNHRGTTTVCISAEILSNIQKKKQRQRRVPYGKIQKDQQHGGNEKSPATDDVALKVSNESFLLLQEETEEIREEESLLECSQESLVYDATQQQSQGLLEAVHRQDDVDNQDKDTLEKTSISSHQNDNDRCETKMTSPEEPMEDADILSAVDTLFMEADIHTFTVKDIISSVQDLFQTKLNKSKRKLIKERLIELVNQVQEEQEQQMEQQEEEEDEEGDQGEEDDVENADNEDDPNEEEEEEQNDPSGDSHSDASDSYPRRRKPKKTRKRKTVKKRSNTSSLQTPPRSSRPKRTPSKKRIPSHLKIHHESLRKRQLAEAQLLAEEMQQKVQQRISEEDKKRAEAIAKKFETDTEEMRSKREKERKQLIELLEEKRRKLLSYNVDEMVQEGHGENVEDEDVGHGEVADTTLSCEDMDPSSKCDASSSSSSNKNSIDSSDDEESDEEEELEIVGMDFEDSIAQEVPMEDLLVKPQPPRRKSSPNSVVAAATSSYFSASTLKTTPKNDTTRAISWQKVIHDPRKMLRNKLKAKQVENGNLWLARELGYEKVEDHIRDCHLEEAEKMKERIALEKKRIEQLKMSGNVENSTSQSNIDNEADSEELDENQLERTRLKLDEISEADEEEEDEEMAMAREVQDQNQMNENMDEDESYVLDTTQGIQGSENDEYDDSGTKSDSHAADCSTKRNEEAQNEPAGSNPEAVDKYHSGASVGSRDDTKMVDEENPKGAMEGTSSTIDAQSYSHQEKQGDTIERVDKSDNEVKSKPRNNLWKEVLKKEAELFKKIKTRKGGFLETEAEEEEEEEGVAGLEDFGFTVPSKKKSDGDDDEDENMDVQDDDFENIVDDVSDDEGDEEAGEAARKAMAAQEEKLRHKEILRTMRDGYDGRRGGIATVSGTARGNLAFDQLVAADNKKDAKKLGLANEDELDSDDDDASENAGDDEVEDEGVLLDKILKDRFLNRTNVPAEEFSDSDGDEESIHNDDNEHKPEDEEDEEQELLAKRFARRARMNRLIEMYGADEEFSQGRLLDQSEELRKELKSIRNVQMGAKRQTSFASSATSTGDSSSQFLDNPLSSQNESNLGASEGSLFASTSSLSFSNSLSRNGAKRKSSFLKMCRQSTKRKMSRPAGVALGHVVFAGDSQSSNISKSTVLPSKKSSASLSRQRTTASHSSATRSSLWSKVASNGFNSKKHVR